MRLGDDQRMAMRNHFLSVRMSYDRPRAERMRELIDRLGPDWRIGQPWTCSQDIWRRGPVTNTYTVMVVQGLWRGTSGCEDRVGGVDLLVTTGDFPPPRIR
jgi:hypothetical protein